MPRREGMYGGSVRVGDPLQEVRVDVGERHGAEALDLDHHVLVAADTAGVALVALKRPGDHADAVALADVVLAVDLATVGAVGGQQAYQRYLRFGDGLDAGAGYVAVDAEGGHAVGRVAAHGLELEGGGLRGADEHEPWDHRAHRARLAVGAAAPFLGQVDRLAQGFEARLGLEHARCLYRIPKGGCVHSVYRSLAPYLIVRCLYLCRGIKYFRSSGYALIFPRGFPHLDVGQGRYKLSVCLSGFWDSRGSDFCFLQYTWAPAVFVFHALSVAILKSLPRDKT